MSYSPRVQESYHERALRQHLESEVRELKYKIKRLERDNYNLKIQCSMDGQPELIKCNHVLLCLGAAIFDVFNIKFTTQYSYNSQQYVGSANDFATALFHLKAFMATCKLVYDTIKFAVRNNESSAPCYHFLQDVLHLQNTCRNHVSAFRYIRQCLLEYDVGYLRKDLGEFPKFNKCAEMMSEMKATFECYYNKNTDRFNFVLSCKKLPSYMTYNEFVFASLMLPKRLHLFAPNQELHDEMVKLMNNRNTLVRNTYALVKDFEHQFAGYNSFILYWKYD